MRAKSPARSPRRAAVLVALWLSLALALALAVRLPAICEAPASDAAGSAKPTHRELEATYRAEQAVASEREKSAAKVQAIIDAETKLQNELLEKAEAASESLGDPAPLALGDPRVAPAAPEERELPPGIFDREKTSIPAGTWGNSKQLKVVRLSLDADGNGRPELIRYLDPESQLLIRQEQDRNYDGVTDAWSSYEWGRVVARVLDSNDDGNPDVWETYANGLMTRRETDRDGDGVRNAFYRYQGDSLAEERHDSNNDGQIDLIILYENRFRVSAEEDQDTDGGMDTWTTYVVKGGQEVVARIERDKLGEGTVTIVEVFDTTSGEAVISRMDEDVNGDGTVDVVSIYEAGRLVRREIADPALVEL